MDQVSTVVKHTRAAIAAYGHDHVELEWRLGHRQGSFRPGVGETAWSRLKDALDSSPAFQKSHSCSVERIGDGTKCVENADGSRAWMHKKRLADVDDDPQGTWSMRVSVSFEDAAAVGDETKLKYERKKERWSYQHVCWSIDLTKVSSNLPAQLDEDRYTYEVEIELVDQGMMFERTLDHLVQWGFDIARDVCKIMDSAAT